MEDSVNKNSTQLESELKSLRSQARTGYVLAILFVIVMIIFLIMGQYVIAVLCMIPIIAAGILYAKKETAIKALLSSQIVDGVLEEAFDDVQYEPFGRISDELMDSAHMVFPFKFDKRVGSDYIKAVHKGLPLELSDIDLREIRIETDTDGDSDRREVTVFEGQWLVCDFGKELSGEVHLSANTKDLRRSLKDRAIRLENEAFNEKFLVTADDPEEAFYILTPHMMDYILSMANKSGGDVYMSFLREGKMHIAVKTGKDMFELGKNKIDIEELKKVFLGEIRWYTDIIDELRLEDRLYK
ncbi:MAG: DUF3137 domain-containing protein [Clostridia bacterium]|nr:DUF3137 domain-containing protein [Clostridia bacterium]